MRIDHYAYQRATRVAGVGFLVQLAIGLTLLIFSLVADDTAFLFSSFYVLVGLLAWLGLIIIFNQHKLERLEALEEDELAATRAGAASMFDRADEEIRVAARRLRLMHKWFMPGLSLVMAVALGLLAWRALRSMAAVGAGEMEFQRTSHVGWAVAVCLGFSALSFIVSRFVAGMAKQAAWQNLRGGAAYMVGNALVTLAVAIGIGFRFFKNDSVIEAIAWAIPIFMIVVASEIVANFILNLYRPRVPGETPRPAFDSKTLSMFAAPDNLVRSINEAVNYQFGFDVTSSWGYQLLLRSFAWLLISGFVVLVGLNCLVIVEPSQQAVKLRKGAMVGNVVTSGVMFKLPWPLETAEVYDVTTVRDLHLTARHVRDVGGAFAENVQLWADELEQEFDVKPTPFIVGRSDVVAEASGELEGEALEGEAEQGAEPAAGVPTAAEADRISRQISLVDAEIVVHYRIHEEDDGLLDYLNFSSDETPRREQRTFREQSLKAIALREVSQHLSRFSLDQVLAQNRFELAENLSRQVQDAFDDRRTGIEVVAVTIPLLRPAGDVARKYEELSISNQARQELIARAQQDVISSYAQLVGDPERTDEILAGIEQWTRYQDELGPDHETTVARRLTVERMLIDAGGYAAQIISEAERDRWVQQMDARAQASRYAGQLIAYRASPELYRRRQTMLVYAATLSDLPKYILGIDPSRMNFDIDVTELTSLFNIGDALQSEDQGGSNP